MQMAIPRQSKPKRTWPRLHKTPASKEKSTVKTENNILNKVRKDLDKTKKIDLRENEKAAVVEVTAAAYPILRGGNTPG